MFDALHKSIAASGKVGVAYAGRGGSPVARALIVSTLLLAGGACIGQAAYAYDQGPRWTIGHGQIVSRQDAAGGKQQLFLRISLRNVGSPGRLSVAIYGRWRQRQRPLAAGNRGSAGKSAAARAASKSIWSSGAQSAPTGKWHMPAASDSWGGASAAPFPRHLASGMRLLGRYQREVSLVSTAILDIPLKVLGPTRRGSNGLEVQVMTAAQLTDSGYVPMAK